MTSPSTTFITPPPRSSSLKRPARAAWMSKLSTPGITNKPRWQPRFFVLVDTELRCYRNQHTDTPSSVIQLTEVCLVVPIASRRLHCFRLEPIVMSQPGKNSPRPLTLACESAEELANWVGTIQLRLNYPSRPYTTIATTTFSMPTGPSPVAAPTTLTRAYTTPTNKPTMSIMQRRRGGGSGPLSPILIHPLDRSVTKTARTAAISYSSSSSSSSSTSPLSSPSTVTLSPTSPPIIINPYYKPNPTYIRAQTSSVASTETADYNTRSSSGLLTLEAVVDEEAKDAYSPTFLQYKERFRL